MKRPCSDLCLPESDSPKKSKDAGDSIASSAMCSEVEKKWDTKTINAMGLDQPRLPPSSLPYLSSPRDSIAHNIGTSSTTQVMQTSSLDVAKPHAAGTVIFWKEPSRRAKRRAKAAAGAKSASVSSKDPDLAAEVLEFKAHEECMMHVVRGTSYSDEVDDSDDNDLPDFSDLPQSDAQGAQPEVSATAEAPFAQPPTAAAPQEPQDVLDDSSSSYH